MGEMRVMGRDGDSRIMWDPNNEAEVTAARNQFNELRAKGHNAYQVDKKGEAGKVVKEFDPAAGKVILAPPMAGG